METRNIISVNELFADDPSDLFVDMGVPSYNRRLTDKILAAFTHAYSVGEYDLAEQLRDILIVAEQRGQEQFPGRTPDQAQTQADLWVEFVETRNRYRAVEESPDAAPEDRAQLLEEMRQAYKRWSKG